MIFCPLCLSKGFSLEIVQGPDKREYRKCGICKLIYTGTKFQLSKKQEKKRYEMHQNGIEDTGYVKFLNKAIEPALPYLTTDMTGLDYGCGPVPTLSKILMQLGFQCDEYDPLFSPNALQVHYDFIFATESFEHFFLPAKELKQLTKLLNEEGLLIIMTEHYTDTEQFRHWYYAKDRTHVSFYHKHSFDFICRKWGFTELFTDHKSVVVLQKNRSAEVVASLSDTDIEVAIKK